ncbi:MAG: DUF1549 domain-containing protein, partial [Planctomycetales bacterium]|nr:DUF1549 domain-containing protein [Planctomycetales bacterium]
MITTLFSLSLALAAADNAPVARWDFGTEETVPLATTGSVKRDQAGPRPPEFPDFAADNTAVGVDGGYFVVPDTGRDSEFDFSNGDTITIEAWVNPSTIREGEPRYIIGKGRTESPKFARDNQNWALRVVGAKNEAKLSFLFATKLSSSEAHWHRWDSQLGFPVGTGWHHIAIAYRFGDPKSIRGWVNGDPTQGSWSYGGETTEPPVVDDDEIRIGNGFEGLLDAIAIHRGLLDDKVVASRFHRVGKPRVVKPQPEVMPNLADVPDGRVLVQLSAGLPAHDRWLNEGEPWPTESARWVGDSFLLPRIPLHFDAWGIRDAWNAPVLLRVAGDVELPPGTHRFLMRGRALGRLWINGKVVARTQPITGRPPDGEERIIPIAEPPLAGARVHGYRQQEVFGEATIEPRDSGKSRVVLELVVGGKGHRTETGEVCVAMLAADGKSYNVLVGQAYCLSKNAENRLEPCSTLPLTDAAIEPVLLDMEESLTEFDDRRRRRAAASQDAFWQQRHELARAWVKDNPAPQPPDGLHPIDDFIASKIDRAIAASAGADARQAEHFHGTILPILRENCFRCHGEKDKGGLKLDSREAALKAGDSEIPAVVPGDLEASELIVRIRAGDMPPTEDGLSKQQIELLEQWVKDGAPWPAPPVTESDVMLSPVVGDEAFLRRVYLDTVGVPPTADEARAFLGESPFVPRKEPDGTTQLSRSERRQRLIEELLDDDRFADGWMNFWLDLLAENPTLLNQSMGSTGPFRWFLYDSLRDNKPLDRMVTELIMMRGGAAEGGSAGFGLAAENDSPLAAKAHIVASAFLGIELQCARCHDSPYHSTTQKDLYSLAAMLSRKSVTVPKTSRVPAAFFENQQVRKSLIQVTLAADQSVPS